MSGWIMLWTLYVQHIQATGESSLLALRLWDCHRLDSHTKTNKTQLKSFLVCEDANYIGPMMDRLREALLFEAALCSIKEGKQGNVAKIGPS